MPYILRKIRNKDLYKVINSKTKEVHSSGSTLANAKAQIRLLENLSENKGEGLALNAFTSEDAQSPILLPILNEVILEVPKYFIYQVYPKNLKQNERRFKVFIPTTNTNKLSSRLKKTSIEVKSVDNDEIKLHENKDNVIQVPPKLSEFSKQDQTKLREYFLNVEDNIKNQVKAPEIREQKPKGRKIKYDTKEEAKAVQAQQKREASKKKYNSLKEASLILKQKKREEKEAQKLLNKQEKIAQKLLKKQQQGSGIIKSIKKIGNKVVNKISKVGKQTGKFIEKVINPDDFMPPSVKDIMNNYGQEIITSITLRRNPVSKLIIGAMNAVSLGSFKNKLDQQPYDKLFHLAMLVQTNNNTKFLLEKIERVNISKSIGNPEGLETLAVPLNGKEINVFDLINNTKEQMGKTNFLDYDPVSNNCQVFIMNVLDSNGLLNDENKLWTKQDTEVLFKGNKTLAKISKKLTDIGASANVLLHGGKIINKNYEKNNISSNTIMNDLSYSLPQKQMQHEQQLYSALQNSSSLPEPLQAGSGIIKRIKRVGNKIGRKINQGIDMVEGGINTIEDIEDKVDKTISRIKGLPEEARMRLKNVGLDVAEILLKRGVPVTAGTLAGIMATAMTGQPAAGIAASIIAGYSTQMAVNKLAKEEDINGSSGNGLFAGGQIAGGLYAQGRGMDSDSEDECCCYCGMSGGRLLVDKKFSIRNVYDAAKSVPKVYKENMSSLKSGNQEGGTLKMPPQPKIIKNGIVAPRMGGKGSPEMKAKMAKLRAMRKGKKTKLEY
jgi:hypothetical protein